MSRRDKYLHFFDLYFFDITNSSAYAYGLSGGYSRVLIKWRCTEDVVKLQVPVAGSHQVDSDLLNHWHCSPAEQLQSSILLVLHRHFPPLWQVYKIPPLHYYHFRPIFAFNKDSMNLLIL